MAEAFRDKQMLFHHLKCQSKQVPQILHQPVCRMITTQIIQLVYRGVAGTQVLFQPAPSPRCGLSFQPALSPQCELSILQTPIRSHPNPFLNQSAPRPAFLYTPAAHLLKDLRRGQALRQPGLQEAKQKLRMPPPCLAVACRRPWVDEQHRRYALLQLGRYVVRRCPPRAAWVAC